MIKRYPALATEGLLAPLPVGSPPPLLLTAPVAIIPHSCKHYNFEAVAREMSTSDCLAPNVVSTPDTPMTTCKWLDACIRKIVVFFVFLPGYVAWWVSLPWLLLLVMSPIHRSFCRQCCFMTTSFLFRFFLYILQRERAGTQEDKQEGTTALACHCFVLRDHSPLQAGQSCRGYADPVQI